MKRILVVNVNWLGDVIFSAPVFKALKQAYPQSWISCVGVPRVKDILESIPHIDEVIVYDEKKRHWDPFSKLIFILALRKRKFDSAFLLHRSFTRALIIFLSGIPQRVGTDTKKRGILLTHIVKPIEGCTHRADEYLNVIESFGVPVVDRASVLSIAVEAHDEVQEFLRDHDIKSSDTVVLVNPGGNWDLKRWPLENYVLLIDRLLSQNNFKVIVAGATKDQSLGEALRAKTNHRPIMCIGQMSLKQLLALMKRADIVVSADSGPLHMANSIGTATVGIYGPTEMKITGPRGSGVSVVLKKDVGCNREPCYHLKCPDNICMKAIDVEEVHNAITKILH